MGGSSESALTRLVGGSLESLLGRLVGGTSESLLVRSVGGTSESVLARLVGGIQLTDSYLDVGGRPYEPLRFENTGPKAVRKKAITTCTRVTWK